jgi:hypothetical protein
VRKGKTDNLTFSRAAFPFYAAARAEPGLHPVATLVNALAEGSKAMTGETNRFVVEKKKTPAKTDAKTRIENFNEIYADFKPVHAEHQASRC